MSSQARQGTVNPSIAAPATFPEHDDSKCPIVNARRSAEANARNVQRRASNIPDDHRGVTPWLDLGLRDLPSSTDCMQPDADRTNIRFGSLEAALAYRKLLLEKNTSAVDNTIPSTAAQKQAHVKALFKAFKCIPGSDCKDRDDMKKWFREQRHNNELVEVKCWEILNECITRSKHNNNLVEAHEPGKFRFKSSRMTFEERFNEILRTMAISKTICKHLFDVSFVLKFVDDPAHNRARVDSNRVLNDKKAQIMKRGKEEQEKDKDEGTPTKRPRLDKETKHQKEQQETGFEPFSDNEVREEADYLNEVVEDPYERTPARSLPRQGARANESNANEMGHAANPGSMSAPQMRHSMRTPGAMNFHAPVRQSPLFPYAHATGLNNNIGYGSPTQNFMTPQGPRSRYPPQHRHQASLLSSSPYSTGLAGNMPYSDQTPMQPILRPDSAMSYYSQATPFQQAHQSLLEDPWTPQTPTPAPNSRALEYDNLAMNNNMAMAAPNPDVTYESPLGPSPTPSQIGPDSPHWVRYRGRARLAEPLAPIPVRPMGYPIPEEVTPAVSEETEQQDGQPTIAPEADLDAAAQYDDL